ncbi:OmpA family protein [Ancylobacter sp. A5.8]|uniref:OmpA family protein n=1 Tax=Ancylobacter gelatini TaxID=2919920 RepID=UPI001F4EE558|nr:OmpA family protein [Ancylobacter gelatini]MCJ8141417.1 OmpA family protein [Ancylobacter gelatini]
MSRTVRFAARLAGGIALAAVLAGPLASGASAQTNLSNAQILQGLTMTTADEPTITAQILKQMAQTAVANNIALPLDKSEIAKQLDQLAQITVQIQFSLNSAIIKPESYATIGSIADALHHPILWGYRFLVVGNTDTTGNRKDNLELSQRRADAVMEALVTLYKVDPARLEAVGLGQEALQTPNDPTNPVNRRVQIFNIGKE